MRIFIACATGVIGRVLVPLLVGAGHEVIGTSFTARDLALRALGATPVQADVFDADGLRQAVKTAAPDAVIHELTALGTGDRAANTRIRQEGTRNLVEAAKRAGVERFVVQSVAWAYAPATPRRMRVPRWT